MTRFWNNLHQGQNILKPNNIKTFGSKKTNGHTQDRQNLLRPSMPEGG